MWLFACIILIKKFSELKMNNILQASLLKLLKKKIIVKLFEMRNKKHYILHVKHFIKKNEIDKHLKWEDQLLLLNCNYDIQFM